MYWTVCSPNSRHPHTGLPISEQPEQARRPKPGRWSSSYYCNFVSSSSRFIPWHKRCSQWEKRLVFLNETCGALVVFFNLHRSCCEYMERGMDQMFACGILSSKLGLFPIQVKIHTKCGFFFWKIDWYFLHPGSSKTLFLSELSFYQHCYGQIHFTVVYFWVKWQPL